MVKFMYNIKVLSYLIGSYNKMLSSFGESSKTVKVFREQVLGLVNIGQVSQTDVDLVFSIIGMTNTDSVKFDISKKNISCFILAMNYMETYKDDKNTQYIALKELKAQKKIGQKIYDIVLDIYDLKALNTPAREIGDTFGKIQTPQKTRSSKTTKTTSTSADTNIETAKVSNWSKFIEFCKEETSDLDDLYFSVTNPYACCSHDTTSYYKHVLEVIQNFRDCNTNTEFMKLLKHQAMSFSIVEKVEYGDACHSRFIYQNQALLTEAARKLVLEEIR